MPRNYYYFVAGLPGLQLDKNSLPVTVHEFVGEAASELHPADFELLNRLRLPFDNANILGVISKKKTQFDGRAVYSEAELAGWITQGGAKERYLEQFLDGYEEGRSEAAPGDILACFFYDEMASSDHPFVAAWYSFERNLRNCCSALTGRRLALAETAKRKPGVIGNDAASDAFATSAAVDFGLSKEITWLSRVSDASTGTMVSFEKAIDVIRWETLDEMTTLADFGIERILAWFVKLTIAERWVSCDAERGRNAFNDLCSALTAAVHVA